MKKETRVETRVVKHANAAKGERLPHKNNQPAYFYSIFLFAQNRGVLRYGPAPGRAIFVSQNTQTNDNRNL